MKGSKYDPWIDRENSKIITWVVSFTQASAVRENIRMDNKNIRQC